ncbi:F0F1 ATP synthase subunit epsilon [Seohaeicola zhoushanensis]|uniref:ATP synthase epsilon chain n=1 Tax=Seohaeicola zhoushanensis TaxID=1569283 RepID=A0A8J3GZ12_9RHOB|nr:F0F1 ATP synthase subunit epsilon [Seohaeicola zhoushanensis]GHF60542.1 ATP synthase epsilon chain 2 [Seohaeicola zhoushanensis]
MTDGLSLSIATPLRIVLDETGILSLRGEDASGGFGILPGHADYVTVIDAGVLRWRGESGPWRYCVVRGAVFTVSGGETVHVACRDAVTGDDLATLQAEVAESRRAHDDASRRTRAQSARLHARAIRRLMHGLALGGDTVALDGEGDEP